MRAELRRRHRAAAFLDHPCRAQAVAEIGAFSSGMQSLCAEVCEMKSESGGRRRRSSKEKGGGELECKGSRVLYS